MTALIWKIEMKKPNIIINSTLLFVIATLWQQTLHELVTLLRLLFCTQKR